MHWLICPPGTPPAHKKAHHGTLLFFGAILKFYCHVHRFVATLTLTALPTSHITPYTYPYPSHSFNFLRKYKSVDTFWRSLVYCSVFGYVTRLISSLCQGCSKSLLSFASTIMHFTIIPLVLYVLLSWLTSSVVSLSLAMAGSPLSRLI
jgi:hypothetical protein